MINDKFISLTNWLSEQKEEKPLYGCVMMDPSKIEGWEENHLAGIDDDDIYIDEKTDSGLEENPHITIIYGIHENEVDPSVVVDMIEQKMEPIVVHITEIDVFENEKYDVVKYNVPVTKELQKYRDMFLKSFENTQKFKGYNPHMTIAYVKPGTGKKYKKTLNEPFDVRFVKGVYSYHKVNYEEGDDLTRRVINLEPEKEKKKSSGIVKSKPFKKK